MKMNSYLTLLGILIPLSIFSQLNDAKIVLGAETSLFLLSSNSGGKIRAEKSNLVISIPLNQWSFGIGIGLKKTVAGKFRDYDFNRKRAMASLKNDLVGKEPFYYSEFKLSYLNMVPRIYYRLPCNCVSVFTGLQIDYLRSIEKERVRDKMALSFDRPYLLEEVIEPKTIKPSLEFGTRLHFMVLKQLRIAFSPTYVFDFSPSKSENTFFNSNNRNLVLNLAVEYGFN